MSAPTIEMRLAEIPITAEGCMAFGAVWPKFESSITLFARRLTKDRLYRDDLVQEAMIALWKIDPTRYDFNNEAHLRYMHRVMINRICDVCRAPGGPFQLAGETCGCAQPGEIPRS